MFIRHFFNANNIFNILTTAPLNGMPDFANMVVSKSSNINPNLLKGCGIYFILHRKKLVYIGKFQGTMTNAFAGDIFSCRWNRHVSTLSLRGKNISIGTSLVTRFSDELYGHQLTSKLSAIEPKTLARDRGFMVSFNRLKFAALKWESFSSTADNWLPDLDFGYVQLNSTDWINHSTKKIRSIISNAEKELITLYSPLCNAGSPFEEHLIREIALEELFGSIEIGLSGETIVRSEGIMPIVNQVACESLPEDILSPAYAEQLFEALPSGCPEETVLAIYDAFGLVPEVQVHSTKTNGGDIRIRVLNIRKPRNLFTMYWQVNNNVFYCRIQLPLNQVEGPGIVDAVDSPVYETLRTSFKFDCSSTDGSISNLIQLIRNAIQNTQ